MKKTYKIDFFVYLIGALSLVLLPILAPYEMFGPFSISHSLLIVAYLLSVLYTKKIYFIKSLALLFTVHFVLSIAAFIIRIDDVSSQQIPISLIYILINIIIVMQVIRTTPRKYFLKSALIMGIISSIFLCYQYILVFFNVNPPDGKIPFLIFSENSGWAAIDVNNMYLRRVHSFFPEPSYFAIYILPLLALTLFKNRIILSIFFLISLFLSTSSLGIIGSLILVFTKLIKVENLKEKRKYLWTLCLVTVSVYLFNDFDIFNYNTEKIQNLDENSNIRLTGYFEYFFLLPETFQIVGVGSNQFASYFAEFNLKNYSNAFVLSLLNFGFLGFVALLVFIINGYIKYKNSRPFILIFFIICCIDAFLYNMYFYYILSYIYLFSPHNRQGDKEIKRFQIQ